MSTCANVRGMRIRHILGIFLATAVLSVATGCHHLTPITPDVDRSTPLRIVEVGAPDINCIFDGDCRITVDDSSDRITLSAASGEGFLQSRTGPPGEPGTRGEGLIPYEYRIDLRQLGGLTARPCITELTIDFGLVRPLDYDRDGDVEDVYVVTRGGLGSVGLTSVEQIGGRITFQFQPAVCVGNRPGAGESTYFFGLAAEGRPRPVTAQAISSLGDGLRLEARAPGGVSGGVVPGPVAGLGSCLPGLSISEEAPVCRCLGDPIARELRCGVLHPHFLLVRRTPLPIPLGEPFTVRWSFAPLDRFSGAVVVEDGLAPGFSRPQGTPPHITFSQEIRPGKSITQEYRLMAPREGAELSMPSLVTFRPSGGQGEPESFELLLPIGPEWTPDLSLVSGDPPLPRPPRDPDFGTGACGRGADQLWDEHLEDNAARTLGPSFGHYVYLRDRADRCRQVRREPSAAPDSVCVVAGERAWVRCFLEGEYDCHRVERAAIDRCVSLVVVGPLDDILGGRRRDLIELEPRDHR